MEGNIVSPTGCTQPSRLTSPELVYGTGGAIDDRHRPDVEIRTSRANYRLPNPALNGMLLTAYMYLAWLVVILAIMGLCTTSVYFMSPVNSPVEFFADAFASHLTLYVVWLASAYLTLHVHAWKMGARMNKYIWNMSARMHKYTPCVILPFTLALMLLMVSDRSGYGCFYSAAQGTWRTGLLPTAPSVCEQRLEETQHILLHTEYYSAQFARALIQNVSERDYVFSWLNFNETRFLQIHNNEDLCYQGFEGNPDIYGLGVRLCIYLQWIVALITNNLLPHGRPTHQAAWLIFSIGMCIVAFLASTADYCVFGIEIEILYWVYWGGFACVYASAPSLTRLRGQVKWVALEWSTAIRYTLHILMACHGVWFSWWGYDQAFARMPCGTYQFMLAKFLDPSTSYSYARDFLSLALNMMATPFLLVLSVATVIMALEIKASVQNLASGSNGDESERYAAGLPTRVHDRFLSMTREVYSFVVWLMDPSPGDIRLITPVDVQQRRSYRIRCLLMWLVSFSISVTAIETTLSWNRVTSVHSLTSLGQMLSLIIGMATFISVIWELFKQESKRRQDAKRRRIAPGDTLPQLPLTLSGAIRSAFHQLDEPFLTNAVALPSFKTNPPGSEVLSDNGSYTTGADNRMGLQSSDATWQ